MFALVGQPLEKRKELQIREFISLGRARLFLFNGTRCRRRSAPRALIGSGSVPSQEEKCELLHWIGVQRPSYA